MIAGATSGSGGAALGRHLSHQDPGAGELSREGESRGLVSETTKDRIAELTDIAARGRGASPIHHVHADPPIGAEFGEGAWERYWDRYESEFGLSAQPFAEAIHTDVETGREHRHRVYSLVRPDGGTIPMHHDMARREKLGRLTELAEGQALTPGRHNRAVIHALEREGNTDAAAALRAAGLYDLERPRASLTPEERQQQERTGVSKQDVRSAALDAWQQSDGASAFQAALAERGLQLVQGRKTVQIMDQEGNLHDLRRSLTQAAKGAGIEAPQAADVRARLAGISTQGGVAEARSAEQAPPWPEPPPGGAEARPNGGGTQASTTENQTSSSPQTSSSVPTSSPEIGNPVPSEGITEAAATPPAAQPPLAAAGVRPPAQASGGGTGVGGGGGGGPPGLRDDTEEGRRAWALALTDYYSQQSASASTSSGGPSHDTASKDDIAAILAEVAQWTGSANRSSSEEATSLGNRRHAESPGGHSERPGIRTEGGGLSRHDTRPDGGAEIGDADRIPAASPRLAGADDIGRTEQDRPSPGPLGEDRSESTETGENARGTMAQAGRRRAEDGRIGKAISTAISPDRAARIQALTAALEQSAAPAPQISPSEGARMLLATDTKSAWARVRRPAPWPDPFQRDARTIADGCRQAAHADYTCKEAMAKQAQQAAVQARAQVRPLASALAVIGIRTETVIVAQLAEATAREAQDDLSAERDDLRSRVADATSVGEREAGRRTREQQSWEQSPDVRQATEIERLNTAALRLAQSGDPAVQSALAGGDPAAARAEVQRREAEQRRQQEEQRAAMERQAQAQPGGPTAPAPRMR